MSGIQRETVRQQISDDASFTDDSCPWCLHPSYKFVIHDDGTVSCPNCRSRIPVDADWYQNGDKIIV